MNRHRPDLIVPIKDRRQRKRYLTLKNFGWFMLAAVVIFIGITIRSEMRGRPTGDYGRLFRGQVAADVEQKPVEVIHEAPPPVDDATHADPMLVAPAARAQILEGEQAATATVAPVAASTVTQSRAKGDVAIVGGPDGVAVVQQERRKPVLSGGFGRQ
jgi:hypothetical protein